MSGQTREETGERDDHGRFLKGSAAAREAGSKGGTLSTGSFVKGDERAREAGRKGGRKGGRWSFAEGRQDEETRGLREEEELFF